MCKLHVSDRRGASAGVHASKRATDNIVKPPRERSGRGRCACGLREPAHASTPGCAIPFDFTICHDFNLNKVEINASIKIEYWLFTQGHVSFYAVAALHHSWTSATSGARPSAIADVADA
ncbi:hypothetical protein EVAR_74501_1 [Eumeta japonica]|uniref:Uncharacterized protein n=1 Tax=Eumeta variegata TaxID=151549 RepID=A0A4C1TEY4_EUMVA|nr:hypothetical protein EVAR_74501_1 [Eumeta japonica]